MPESLLHLESWLKKHSNGEKFPNPSINYFERYKTVKAALTPLLDQVNASLAQDGGIHTDHGPKHVEQVARYAGKLLQCESKSSTIELQPYEVYLLLTAILAHDAGNVRGREKHEQRPFEILHEYCASIISDTLELKAIADIATAHGGKYLDSKDTIHRLKESDSFNDISFRPRLLAGLVRLADEICENSHRAATDEKAIKAANLLFHKYAKCISSTTIDRDSKRIHIDYKILVSQISLKFESVSGKKIFIIDEIFNRLEKMSLELTYCSKFIWEIIKLDGIQAKIAIVQDRTYDTVIEHRIELLDRGYPNNKKQLAKIHHNWTGIKLKKRWKDGDFDE
jgi:hypothetical protein